MPPAAGRGGKQAAGSKRAASSKPPTGTARAKKRNATPDVWTRGTVKQNFEVDVLPAGVSSPPPPDSTALDQFDDAFTEDDATAIEDLVPDEETASRGDSCDYGDGADYGDYGDVGLDDLPDICRAPIASCTTRPCKVTLKLPVKKTRDRGAPATSSSGLTLEEEDDL